MAYQTKRERTINIVENIIIPAIKKSVGDVDYYEVLKAISTRAKITNKEAESVVEEFIINNILKEVRILTIPDEEVSDWLKDYFDKEKEMEEEDKKIKEVFENAKKTKEIGENNNK